MTTDLIGRLKALDDSIGNIPQIKRGRVWCTECGATQKVNGANAIAGGGWPKCCGYTMTIDSPEERNALEAKE